MKSQKYNNTVKIMKTNNKAILPKRETKGSAGMDLRVCIDKSIVLPKGKSITLPTGIAIEIEDSNVAAFAFARSGLGIKHGITLSNGVGIIDNDYRGEIQVGLVNLGDKDYEIKPNERVVQLVFMPICLTKFIEVDKLDSTDRGQNGLGSTGRTK